MELDATHYAALQWSRLTEGQDRAAALLIAAYGLAPAWKMLEESQWDTDLVEEKQWQRWQLRLSRFPRFNLQSLTKLGIHILIPGDPGWPNSLNDLGDLAPLALWVRGNISALRTEHLSMVGARNASDYGAEVALEFASDLSANYTIVSGGAYGIDAAAHTGTLLAKGLTVLVTAGGVDRCYPSGNKNLYENILANQGVIISESPLGASPQRHRFLTRNRIIAALGKATIVIEAGLRSGALNTANHAINLGREVGAVPGSVLSSFAAGTHALIRDGATLVANPDQVRELIEPIGHNNWFTAYANQVESREIDTPIDEITRRVLDAVPLTKYVETGSIAALAGLDVPLTRQKLSKLVMQNLVCQRDGLWKKIR